MSKKSKQIAHELFYPSQPGHCVRDGDRFRIEHGADYSIAFSYDTPIALYGHDSDYVLLNTAFYTVTTSGHQKGLLMAVPYHVKRIEFPWPGVRDTPLPGRNYAALLAGLMDNLRQNVQKQHPTPDILAYAKERQEACKTWEGLLYLLRRTGKNPRLQQQLEHRLAQATDTELIRNLQKQLREKERKAKARKVAEYRRTCAHSALTRFMQGYTPLSLLVEEVTNELLQKQSVLYICNVTKDYIVAAQGEPKRAQDKITHTIISTLNIMLKRQMFRIRAYAYASDDLWYDTEDDLYHTSRHVTLDTAELQRMLTLWKHGRILGERVNGRYPVTENNSEHVTIGCHRFALPVVQSIYDRYAGRREYELQHREPAYRQECIELIAGLVRRALDLLRPAIRKQAWYADLSAKAGTP